MKLVIISFTFPPKAGVGGRRWAKFAKWFRKKGHDVVVLTSLSKQGGSPWSSDIEDFKENIISVEQPLLPSIISSIPKTFLQKVKYHIALFLMMKMENGNYYDASVGWSKFLRPHLKELRSSGYTHVVASGGPFHYLLAISEICKELNLRFVSDFRDPWTNNKTSFGYSELSAKRLIVEQQKEAVVIGNSDAVISVAQPMTDYFQSFGNEKKFHTIINGYDSDEVSSLVSGTSMKLRLVFVGTLYNKALQHVHAFRDALDLIENIEQFEIHFYGEMTEQARSTLESSSAVRIHGTVPVSKARDAIAMADLCMLFLTDDLTYSFSTKFCEYVAASKPILVISQAGITGDYVEEHRIGCHSLPDAQAISRSLNDIHSERKQVGAGYDKFDSSEFNLERLADMYLDILENA
ncbi:MAG: glycosyltransferase [Flavobacteriales bacterium]|nr:glycosyltransferase [Flavobacteriales bacterium]